MTSSDRRDDHPPTLVSDVVRIAVPLVLVVLLAAAWQLTPLRELGPEIRDTVASLRHLPAAPVIVVGVFVLGGLLIAPVSLLMLATVVTFGPVRGALYALAGVLASASIVFFVGRVLGRSSLERVLGERMQRVEGILNNHGVVTVAVSRNIPVAPFSVVNLIAGASPLRFRDYFFGTLLGVMPAIFALAAVGDSIAQFAHDPDRGALLTLVGVVAALAALAVLSGRWLLRRYGS